MIPVRLKLSNFTSYGESPPELDFTQFKMAAISGPNGAGKSSLLDAITWCVWGSSRAGDSSDDLVHLGANHMNVEFSFELDNHLYTVKRLRNKKGAGSTSLELWSNNHNLTEGTIKATQEKIINTLHLTFETFTNSAFLRQGHADEFTLHGPTDRKRILAEILGLDHYDLLEEKAKEKIKEAQTKLQLLEYQLLEIEAELSQKEDHQKNLSQAQKEVAKLEGEIKTFEATLKLLHKEKETLNIALKEREKLEQTLSSQQEELEQIKARGLERAQRIKQLEQSLESLTGLEEKLAGLKNLQKQQQEVVKQNQQRLELEKLISETESKINLAIQARENIQKELNQLDSQIKSLAGPKAICPTCGQEIGQDKKHRVLKELTSQKSQKEIELKNINTQKEEVHLHTLKQQSKKYEFDPQLLEKIQEKLKSLEELQTQKEQLLKNQASLATEKKTVSELRELFKKKVGNIKSLEEELKKLPQVSQALLKINQDLEEKEGQLESLKVAQKGAQTILGQARQLITRTEQLEKLNQKKGEEKQTLEKDKQIFEELALAFSKKGIQAMIIESAIPEIEEEANRLLDRLTEGRMKIRLETQKETKTKVQTAEGKMYATVETLDIIISDEMGERPYELYSGGEAFRVNFALRLAISKLLTNRAGARLQFLVIDEGFGTQDTQGRGRIVEVIDSIKDDFEKILIITHLDELKEEFPVRVEVSKNSEGSTFELVGV